MGQEGDNELQNGAGMMPQQLGIFEAAQQMIREPIKVQIPLGAEPWQITQEIINKLVRQGGRLVDDYGFEWILPGPRERERYYLTFTLETEYRGETIRVHARKVAGWQQLLEKLRSARLKAGKTLRYGISEPAIKQITFGGEAVKLPSPMEKLLIEFLEKDPFSPTSYVMLAKIKRGEEPSQYEWLSLEHALLLKKYDIPKWRQLWEHYNNLGKFKVEFKGVVRENAVQMPFSTTRTGIPFYDMMLEKPEYFLRNKGLVGKIVYMSPDEYIEKAVKCMGTTVERFVRLVDEEFIKRYAEGMMKGVKFDMPVIECERGYQEGRHRVLAAKRLGVAKIPVFWVEKAEAPMIREALAQEPWQMTQQEYVQKQAPNFRQFLIRHKAEGAGGERFYEWSDILGHWLIRWSRFKPTYSIYLNNRLIFDARTLEDAAKIRAAMIHKSMVLRALLEGKPVPPEVLRDYPDLGGRMKPTVVMEAKVRQ